MAQIFPSSFNVLARLSVVLGAAAPLGIIFAASTITRSPYNTNVDVPRDQPVPFSHEHHASELGIDCRYCHPNVEKGPSAGLPPTQTCMSCHSQIWTNSPLLEPVRESYRTDESIKWTRVNEVPDFVYFNHSIHINRGINCNVCHGPIQTEQIAYRGNAFRMAWCLECHKHPENYIYQDKDHPELSPREQVFNLYWKAQSKANLSPREEHILAGEDYSPSTEEIDEAKVLIQKYHVQEKQMADCWICHR